MIAGVVDLMPTDMQHRQVRHSKGIIIHPRFRPMRLAGYDVGLVHVYPPFNFTDVVFRVEISEKGEAIMPKDIDIGEVSNLIHLNRCRTQK